MFEKIIQMDGRKIKVGCDGKCNKAWGIQNRPYLHLRDDPNDGNYDDDIVFLSDLELDEAPVDPGTYEGGFSKPTPNEEKLNRWCVRECERCEWQENINHPVELKDFSVRQYNMSQEE